MIRLCMCIYYEMGTSALDCGRKWCVSEYNLGYTLTVIIYVTAFTYTLLTVSRVVRSTIAYAMHDVFW